MNQSRAIARWRRSELRAASTPCRSLMGVANGAYGSIRWPIDEMAADTARMRWPVVRRISRGARWRGKPPDRGLRRFIEIEPVLDFNALSRRAATRRSRRLPASQLAGDDQARVGLTPGAMNDAEFATLKSMRC